MSITTTTALSVCRARVNIALGLLSNLHTPQDMHAGKFKCEENDFAQTIIKSSLFICKTCSTLLCSVCSREDLHLKAASNPTQSQPDTPSIKSLCHSLPPKVKEIVFETHKSNQKYSNSSNNPWLNLNFNLQILELTGSPFQL